MDKKLRSCKVILEKYSKFIFCFFPYFFLLGCDFVILNPAGYVAEKEKNIIIIAVLLMLSIVLLVAFLSLYFAWKYRASNTKAVYSPEWDYSFWLEFFWWLIPCVIIIILSIMTWQSSHKLDPYKPISSPLYKKPLEIQVVSLDWKWLFIYPEQNIATLNFFQAPVDQPVRFKLTSDAPMNSFWIPQLGSQIMTMPGMQTQLYMMATKKGEYKGYSANFSGDGFSHMTFYITISSPEVFEKWVQQKQRRSNVLTKARYNKLAQQNVVTEQLSYSAVAKNLFHDIMMKYMVPVKNDSVSFK